MSDMMAEARAKAVLADPQRETSSEGWLRTITAAIREAEQAAAAQARAEERESLARWFEGRRPALFGNEIAKHIRARSTD